MFSCLFFFLLFVFIWFFCNLLFCLFIEERGLRGGESWKDGVVGRRSDMSGASGSGDAECGDRMGLFYLYVNGVVVMAGVV